MALLQTSVREKYLGRVDVRGALQTMIVAFSFVLFNQYWRVDEHVVFILIALLTTLGMFGTGPDKPLRIGSVGIIYLFVAFLSWIMVSALWSPTLHSSLAYALLVVMTGATAVAQGILYGLREVIGGIAIGVLVIGAHIASVGFLSERNGVLSSGLGLYTNPSSLSFVLGVGLIAAAFWVNRTPTTWVLVAGFVTLGVTWLRGLSILTAFIALLGSLYAWVALSHVRVISHRWRKLASYGYTVMWLVGGVIFWFFRGPILRPLGEDESLGERIPLWQAYFEAVLWRPWLGSGWGSTVGWDFPLSRDRLSPVYEWFPAHNGYLDIALMLGVVGLFLFLAVLAVLFWQSLRLAVMRSISWRSMFMPVILTYLILNDVMATSFPKLIGVFLVGVIIGSTVQMRGDSNFASGVSEGEAGEGYS